MADEEYEQPQEEDQGYGDEEPQQQEEQQYDAPAEAEPEPEYQAEPEPEPEYQAEPEPEPEPEPEYKEPEPEPEPEPQYAAANPSQADASRSVENYCDELYGENPSFSWFSCKLKNPKKGGADLVVDKTGKGGLPELKSVMEGEAENIVFFLLRVNTLDNEQSSRAKFVYGRYVGSKVKFMQKAKLTPNLGQIADKFAVKHLSKDCDEEMKGWDSTNLSKEFLRIGGAHKPSKYDYGGGDVYAVPKGPKY